MVTTSDARRETVSLVGSDKVQGAAVYSSDSKKIGKIERIMIDKISGKVAYAVLTFGGFLGIGEDYYPLPWASLKYDTKLDGYVTGIPAQQLKTAPRYDASQGWNWSDPANDQKIYQYYNMPLWY